MEALRGEIVLGRRFCSRCERWRAVHEFYVRSRWPDGEARSLASLCITCARLYQRERHGFNPRPQDTCRNGHPHTPENVGYSKGKRHCKACKRARYAILKQDPDWYERKREYERIWNEGRRRREGAQERVFKNRRKRAPNTPGDNLDLPLAPFQGWLARKYEHYGELRHLAAAVGMDERAVSRVLSGQEAGKVKLAVRLDTVDRALTNEGSTFLWELYEELYPWERAA